MGLIYTVIIIAIAVLLWLIGMVSTKVRSLLLFFIKGERTRLKLTLIYLIGVIVASIIYLLFVVKLHEQQKQEDVDKAKQMLKQSCNDANNILEFNADGKVLSKSVLNALQKLKKDSKKVDKVISNYTAEGYKEPEVYTGYVSGSDMSVKYNTLIDKDFEKLNTKYDSFEMEYLPKKYNIVIMQTNYWETNDQVPSYSCVLNERSFFFREWDMLSKEERDYDYLRPYSKHQDKTPLIEAADDCNLEAVKYMIKSKQGGDVSKDGHTALYESMLHSSYDREKCNQVSKALIDAGVDIDKSDRDLLDLAISTKNSIIAKYLIKKGHKLKEGDLHCAAYQGTHEIVEALLQEEMDPNGKLPDGYLCNYNKIYEKPILNANSIETMMLLQKQGVDINKKDLKGRTLLHYLSSDVEDSRFENHPSKIARYLLNNGAEVTADVNGWSFQDLVLINLHSNDIEKDREALGYIADLISYKKELFDNYKYIRDNPNLFTINEKEAQWLELVNKNSDTEPLIRFIRKQQKTNNQFFVVFGTSYDGSRSSGYPASKYTVKYDGGGTIWKVQEKVDIPFFIIDNELKEDVARYFYKKYHIEVKSTPHTVFFENGKPEASFIMPFDNSQVVDQIIDLTNSSNSKKTKVKKRLHEKNISNDFLRSDIKYEVLDNKVKLYVNVKNKYKSAKGGLSLSFPQLTNDARIVKKTNKGFSTFNAYGSSSKLWSGKYKRKIYSDYLLIEGWSDKWYEDSEKDMILEIDTSGMDKLVINIRLILVKNRKEYVLPTYGEIDQQGYKNKQIVIDLKEQSAVSFIKKYFNDLKSVPYKQTWNMLSKKIKNKGSFESYIKWWDKKVDRVVLENVEEIKSNVVRVKLRYYMKSGKSTCSVDTFTLKPYKNSWLIDQQKYKKCI